MDQLTITDRITPHSYRKTGATLFYLSGLTAEEIKTLGRWTSIAWLTYVKPTTTLAAFNVTNLLRKL